LDDSKEKQKKSGLNRHVVSMDDRELKKMLKFSQRRRSGKKDGTAAARPRKIGGIWLDPMSFPTLTDE
jgi:hypothetical protein